MQDDASEERTVKRKNQSKESWWTFKEFRTKQDLKKFVDDNRFRPRSGENKSCLQRCRYCKSSNISCSKHMIQIYYDCDSCFEKKNRIVTNGPNCTKSNICEGTQKFELLTYHKTHELSPDLIISDLYQSELMAPNSEDSAFKDIDNLVLSTRNLSISRKDQFYKKRNEFYYWKMEEVFPWQTYISSEKIFIKMKDNIWIEFHGGKKHKEYFLLSSEKDKVVLKSADELVLIDSNHLSDLSKNKQLYEGDWKAEILYQNVRKRNFIVKV